MIIEHELLKKQKRRSYYSTVEVDVYPYATELIEELDKIGIMERMKRIPQLGVVKVSKRLEKSRYDYVVLQLYYHQLIKKNLQTHLKLTYNNPVKEKEFFAGLDLQNNKIPSIGDLLQIISIIYNVGHFANTFTASRAALKFAKESCEFKQCVEASFNDERLKILLDAIIDEENYHRFHLMNSMLILQKCDNDKISVKIAKELLYSYILEKDLDKNSKLHYVFNIFRTVRNVSYVSYDLQIANTPLTIDVCDEKTIIPLFEQLLSEYNDNSSMQQLIGSVSKMLNDTVYNEISNAICYYMISKKIIYKIQNSNNWKEKDYYKDFFIDINSEFNCGYPQKRGYSEAGILKLTFNSAEGDVANKLLHEIEHINHLRVGYYDRFRGEKTIVVSISNRCKSKKNIAFRLFKVVVSRLREICDIKQDDSRYLLATKFFLHYLFDERRVIIKPTVDEKVCVLCSRGRLQRTKHIDELLKNSIAENDMRHEVEHLSYCLTQDKINDTTVTIPASILVYDKERKDVKYCEFDGMIIFPMRKQKEIVFLEAKNSNETSRANNCLCRKLGKLNLKYDKNEIEMHGQDAKLNASLKNL